VSGFLFDTNVVRRWYAKNASTETHVRGLKSTTPLHIYVSCVTMGEIEFGHLSPAATDQAKQAHFRRWIRETFEIPQLPVTDGSAIEYAKFRRRLFSKFTKKGKYPELREDKLGEKIGIDENDLWLVAQACERNLTFVTHDKMEKIVEVVGGTVTVSGTVAEISGGDVRILLWHDP
jgi:tRNA(fMet)-specific endonuclease VapC